MVRTCLVMVPVAATLVLATPASAQMTRAEAYEACQKELSVSEHQIRYSAVLAENVDKCVQAKMRQASAPKPRR